MTKGASPPISSLSSSATSRMMVDGTTRTHYGLDEDNITASRALRKETIVINCLRFAVLAVLIVTAAVLAAGIYHYTRNDERENFMAHFEDSANLVMDSFHDTIERNIGSVSAMSSGITSYALQQQANTNQSFPFVTIPHFEVLGSHLRVQAGSHIVHYMPVVTEEMRPAWEEYAMEHRHHIDDSFAMDRYYQSRQDMEFGIEQQAPNQQQQQTNNQGSRRRLQQDETTEQEKFPMTILDDESNFHPKIWRNQAVTTPGDEPDGGGPYIPQWQRSPINPKKQAPLNMNFQNTKLVKQGTLEQMIREKKAIFHPAVVPIPAWRNRLEANLKLSQYRTQIDELVDGLSTFLTYPVFDSFDIDNREVAGVLATSVYWKVLFSYLLPANSDGIVCVIESPSFNQTFTYQIDGPEATFLGMGDHHDPQYSDLAVSADVNAFLKSRARPQNRAYSTVPLSDDTQYVLKVYPSAATEAPFTTMQPALFTGLVLVVFAFTSVLFLLFSYVVERRHTMMVENVLEHAQKAADTERELNEFLSHEVRNPLSAAISACSFVSTAVNEPAPLSDEDTQKHVREDIEVVSSSLHYINDFLRSMLDIHKASDNKIKIEMAPTDILQDVLEPVSAILYKRMASFEVVVDCPPNLVVMTDSIRLKQVVLNMVRNASKFVEKGFLRMRADVVDQQVIIYVEDSGPGIPLEKQKELFAKFQASLDMLGQGTGIGLNLSKKLMATMGGELWLDGSYDSGVEGCPGACFVVQLNTPPLDMESALPRDIESSLPHGNDLRSSYSGTRSDSFLNSHLSHQAEPADEAAPNMVVPHEQEPAARLNAPQPTTEPVQPPAQPELPPELSVLFVDDDAVLRKLFVRAVKRAMPTWKISEASSGETALRMCEELQPEQYDLIFLDQYMASADKQLLGTETAHTMRSKGISSRICGLSANDLRDSFINSGADDFVMKPMPCKVDELKQLLVRVLKRA
ncbi:respiration control sensor protein ArcB [Seminavis robusta]|uniref:histidine kinase n=1 Tax=Seminavis robusta TaxID=568900 RepID=A0A9N8F232_9STRA|nr:respiration control sensor protein ArcB [Seminavis robusta]|eukprot:Sro2364_g324970.1 respiration control sensor protein ArcB (969) ;mRNA; f:1579-4797